MAKTKATQQSAVATKRGLRGKMANMRKGRGVSLDFFRRNGWFICFLIVVVLILLGMRYRTRVYMRQIKDLRTELKQAENERIEEKARYMSMIRETDMVQMAQKHNLGLVFSDKPPFVLQTDATDSIPPEKETQEN